MTNPTKGGMPKMMRWIRAAIAACAFGALVSLPLHAADQAADGSKFNPRQSGSGAPSTAKVPIPGLMGGVYRADTSSRALTTDSDGNLYTTEAFPLPDQNLTFYNCIANDSLTLGTADSSAVLDTHKMRLGLVIFHLVPRASTGAGTVSRVAWSIRTHVGGGLDSMSVAPIFLYGQSPAVGATMVDTTTAGHLFQGSSTVAWSGENTISADRARTSYASGTSVSGKEFYYPNSIAIPLSSLYGRDPYSPYTSIRVRLLSGPKCMCYVTLVGTPL